jgi:hypothetical protein
MAKTALVSPDIELGKKTLHALDDAHFPVTVALWLREAEDDPWTLVLATPRYGKKDAYLEAVLALRGKVSTFDVKFRLESNRRPFVKALRKIFGDAASVEGMRLGLQSIGGTWIDDAYVYRIKP